MKKLIPILLCVSLIFTLAACGKTESAAPETPAPADVPAATEAPAPEPTPTPKPASGTDLKPSAPSMQESTATDLKPDGVAYPLIVPMGEAVQADLDLDGTPENILVDLEEDFNGMRHVKLKINGVDCSDHLYCEELVQLDDPDPDFYAITDLYDGDPSLEIAIQDWGPSDDYYTNFYRYYDGSLYTIGGVPGLICTAWSKNGMQFDGKGNIYTDMRLDVLQTWYAKATFVLNNAEILELEPAELYEAVNPTKVTLRKDLSAYDGKDGEAFIVDAGVQMTVEATDNMEWLYCKSYTDDWALWFRLNPDNPFEIETPDGFVPVWDALDGLCFAD